jgi:hypothetical protein
MLRLHIVEFFLRAIPEALLFIFASHSFSKVAIVKKKFIISSFILAISIFFIRMLPINFGVHTILSMMIFAIISITVNKINTVKAISVVVVIIIIECICEVINITFIQKILKIDIEYAFAKPVLKSVLGFPSLVMFGVIASLYYLRTIKSEKKSKQLKEAA